jgi:DNA adenine methylase
MKHAPHTPDNNGGSAFLTPLRYPGGKGRLGPWLAKVLKHNGIANGWYIEPYAGGAGAGLYLLTQGHVEHIVINDADPVVYAFWRAATEQTDELINSVRETPVTMDTWRHQKAIVEAPEGHSILEVGFAAFFLNRTNRSGILSAGVIGGKAQAGEWKLNARYRTEDLIQRIRTIGSLSARITVLGMDAQELLSDIGPGLPKRCLVYLDPPYFVKGSLLYRNHYQPNDHAAIARCVSEASYPVIVTYDECPEVRKLYRRFLSTTFSLRYSTTHLARPHTSEALFYRNLELPSNPLLTRGFHLTQQARTKSSIQFQNTLST